MRRTLLLVALLAAACSEAPGARIEWSLAAAKWQAAGSTGTAASLRGLCAIDAKVCWASGANGTVLRTVDGGQTWQLVGPRDADSLDFRSVQAFDANLAWIASAGTPARIYRTEDGGANWRLVHEDSQKEAFFDAFAFWDRRAGILLGDPIGGSFCVLRTDDGEHWQQVPTNVVPAAIQGEGAFAASGSCVSAHGTQHVWLVTGGTVARILSSSDRGASWAVSPLPLQQGRPSQGAFSVAFADLQRGVVVGGDYERRSEVTGTAAYTEDGGVTWTASPVGAGGFRSAVAWLPRRAQPTCIAVGEGGCSFSVDGGKEWRPFGDAGFHAVNVARDGTVWAAGGGGRVVRLEFNNPR